MLPRKNNFLSVWACLVIGYCMISGSVVIKIPDFRLRQRPVKKHHFINGTVEHITHRGLRLVSADNDRVPGRVFNSTGIWVSSDFSPVQENSHYASVIRHGHLIPLVDRKSVV